MQYDAFNGDADGICALHQLRLAEPADGTLITGVKRDIALLRRVQAGAGDRVTVLDISMDKNRDDLLRLLAAGAQVEYFDHHYAGEIPEHPALAANIDPSPDVCTSLLVDTHLNGRYRPWAVVGTFGDNLDEIAWRAAATLDMDEEQGTALRNLGIYLNYNGYGVEVDDLLFPPNELYRSLRPYEDPFGFIAEDPSFGQLRDGYNADMAQTESLKPELDEPCCAMFMLPDAAWARRVSGVFGNRLAQDHPDRAHALLTVLPDGAYRVSVRAPLATKSGADELCRAFPTGGGRQGAAGINHLPADQLDAFIDKFRATFG